MSKRHNTYTLLGKGVFRISHEGHHCSTFKVGTDIEILFFNLLTLLKISRLTKIVTNTFKLLP